MTWEFLLKSALDLSTQGRDDSCVVDPPATAMPITQCASTDKAAEEANNLKPTREIVRNEDVPELSIPLDEEERQILGTVVGYGLPSFVEVSDLGCENMLALQSDESLEDGQNDEAKGQANDPY